MIINFGRNIFILKLKFERRKLILIVSLLNLNLIWSIENDMRMLRIRVLFI